MIRRATTSRRQNKTFLDRQSLVNRLKIGDCSIASIGMMHNKWTFLFCIKLMIYSRDMLQYWTIFR